MRVKCTGSTVNIHIIGITTYSCFVNQNREAGNVGIEGGLSTNKIEERNVAK